MPQNVIENIEKRLIKMNRKLKIKFGQSQASFEKQLAEEVQPDANGNISVDQLKNFVLTHCEDDLMNRRLVKKDIESFLSSFNYNQYGATDINGISKMVFAHSEDIQA